MAEKMKGWNSETRHDRPDGDYVGATCRVCGVRGFHHPKRAPAYCWPHWQEAQREAEWTRAKWENEMTAEYVPHTPKPDPFRRALDEATHDR